jgi:hypothetical protein
VQRGLGDVELLGRLGEVQVVGEDGERPQGIEGDGVDIYSVTL